MIVTDERVRRFVADRLGEAELYPPLTCMGIEKDGKIVAGAVFNCFTGYDCHFSIAADPGAITRSYLREMGRYVRDQLECGRVTFITEQPFVVDLAKRLGAEVEGRLRNHYGEGRDATVLGLLKEDWRF